jgi:hypothetical protein
MRESACGFGDDPQEGSSGLLNMATIEKQFLRPSTLGITAEGLSKFPQLHLAAGKIAS